MCDWTRGGAADAMRQRAASAGLRIMPQLGAMSGCRETRASPPTTLPPPSPALAGSEDSSPRGSQRRGGAGAAGGRGE
eukprot:613251-Prymnesium_polylepis.1